MFPKGNMSKLLKQAKQMQKKMEEAQKELDEMKIDGQAGGGIVSSTVNGRKEIISLSIDKELLNEDLDIIEDLIIAAISQAQSKADELTKDKMSSISGGLPDSGFPGF